MCTVYWFSFFLSVCWFICSSFSVSISLSVCSVHLCRVWMASAEYFLCTVCFPPLWLREHSSVRIWVPALWGLIIPNPGTSAEHARRVGACQIYGPVKHTSFYSLSKSNHNSCSLNHAVIQWLTRSFLSPFICSFAS